MPTVRLIAVLLVALTAAHALARPPGAPWRPELGLAFEAYYEGDDQRVRQLCRERVPTGGELALQAQLLEAFTMLRSSDRNQRVDGQVAVGTLTRDARLWLDQPETQLALARGFLGLAETSAAIDQYRRAVRGFADRDRPKRYQVALQEYAQAWTAHTEWERPPAGQPVISDLAERERVRREQLRQIRARAEATPDAIDCVQAIDLAWARYELTSEQAASGVQRLQAVLRTPRSTPTWAAAVLALAPHDAATVEPILEQLLRSAWVPADVAKEAGDALRRLRSPQLQIAAPQRVRPDVLFEIGWEASRLQTLRLEMRKLDLPKWLEAQQGRLESAQLPTAGSLQFERELDPAARATQLRLPRGVYVALVQGVSENGESLEHKQLLVSTNLDVSVVTGARKGLIWSSTPSARATFWLHGAFVGRKLLVRDGISRFDLPNERLMLSDDRWVCLLEADGDLAVCQGSSVRPDRGGQLPSGVAVSLAPQSPARGDSISVYGLFVEPGRSAAQIPLVIELVNVDEEPRASQSTRTRPDGSFLVRFRADDLDGEVLTVRVRRDGRPVETLFGHPRVSIPGPRRGNVQLTMDVPRPLHPDEPLLQGTLHVRTSSGLPVGGVSATVSAQAVRLPDATIPYPIAANRIAERRDEVNADGSFDFAWKLSEFDLPAGPLAINLRTQVAGWDSRVVSRDETLLRSANPVHMWFTVPETGRAEQPVPLGVAWSDPQGLAAAARPRVEITGPNGSSMTPAFVPTPGGLFCDGWVPEIAGAYRLTASLPLVDGRVMTRERTVQVSGSATGQSTMFQSYRATWQPEHGVEIAVQPPLATPAFVVLYDADPLAAVALPAGATRAVLPVPEPPSPTARLRVATQTERSLRWVVDAPIERAGGLLPLEAKLVQPPLGPGRSATIELQSDATADRPVFLTARLVPTDGAGVVPWLPGPNGAPRVPSLRTFAAATNLVDGVVDVAPPNPPLSAETTGGLFEGTATWLDSRVITRTTTRLRVPMPDTPGSFMLIVSARTAQGAAAQVTVPLDTATCIAMRAELPKAFVLGDRFHSLVTIRNPGEGAWEGTLDVEAGKGLQLLSPAPSVSVSVPPGGSRDVVLQWEARAVGRGLAKVVLRQDKLRLQLQSLPYAVRAPSASEGSGALLQRRLYRVQLPTVEVAVDGASGWEWDGIDLTDLSRVEIAEDAPVQPGELIVVAEEWRTGEEIDQIDWLQRVPAHMVTFQAGTKGLRSIGRKESVTATTLRYAGAMLPAGLQLHEYVLVATRAGVCQLPLPEVVADGSPLRWEAAPVRVVVPDPAR